MYRENRESAILTLFGSSPNTRILDLFMDNPLFEFTRNEIVEALGMAKSTLYSTLPGLEEAGVIVETRKIGKASLYRLNGESSVVQDLRVLIRRYAKTIAQNETAIDSTVFEEEKGRAQGERRREKG
jgi:DNA-binding transcriptional ArsR family regulator